MEELTIEKLEDTVDYSYKAPRAVATYKRWKSRLKVITVIGWGQQILKHSLKLLLEIKFHFFQVLMPGNLADPTGKAQILKCSVQFLWAFLF